MSVLDPVVLFFLLGLLAGLLRADLRLPPAIYDFVSTLLLLAIGLKGGTELARQSFSGIGLEIPVVVLMGVVITVLAFGALRGLPRMSRVDAASIAAHYGSVSVGTFAVAVAYLARASVPYEPRMALYLVLLEVPGILVGLWLARSAAASGSWRTLAHEIFLGRSVLLLLGGIGIGWLAGPEGVSTLAPLFIDPFKGLLALFLLEMGLIAASHLGEVRRHGVAILGFAILAPLAFSWVGIGTARLLDLSLGGTLLMATLAASASYIAAPAAMRTALPAANPGLSLAAALGITFPFNILVGIPLYERFARLALE